MAAMFRFRPTEVEIIDYCLRLKITGNDGEVWFIPVVDFFKQEPWELPGLYGIETTDQERFYFSPPDMKQPNGKQFNRTTNSGYWKVTGKDKEVWSGGRLIGKKKILVFHLGSAARSKKTDWVMHEYHTTLEELDGTKLPGQKPYVFCRLFNKPKQNSGEAEDHPITSKECLHPEDSGGMAYDTVATGTAKLASEFPDKGSEGRKRKYTSIAGPAKSKRSAASASPATGEFLQSEISDTIPSVEYSDSNSSAENQVAAKPNSFPNTAKCSPVETESDLTQASVSQASVQAEDYPTIYGTTWSTSDTRAPVECGGNNFNASSAENQVKDVVGDSSCVALPTAFEDAMKQDWGSLLRSLSPDLVDNVPTDRVPLQNGTNDPIAYVSAFLDLTPSNPDESLRNDLSSQKTTIPFDRRPRFMESDKDHGSHSAPIARKLNALVTV